VLTMFEPDLPYHGSHYESPPEPRFCNLCLKPRARYGALAAKVSTTHRKQVTNTLVKM